MVITDLKANSIGRKIERLREMKGIKQETLAHALGISQQSVSKIENSQNMDNKKLERIAEALGVSVDAIKNFNEDAAINLIQNNSDTSTNNTAHGIIYQLNSIEKVTELYERLLENQNQKIKLLEEMLEMAKGKK